MQQTLLHTSIPTRFTSSYVSSFRLSSFHPGRPSLHFPPLNLSRPWPFCPSLSRSLPPARSNSSAPSFDLKSGRGVQEGLKFRPLTVVLPIEKIMKEAIKMVLESIYDPEFPDTSHFRSGRGCHSALRRIKEEWGTSRWFLEFDIRKCFHTIDRHRLISILKEEIDDPKFFYSIQKVFSAGRLVGGSTCFLSCKSSHFIPLPLTSARVSKQYASLAVDTASLPNGRAKKLPLTFVRASKLPGSAPHSVLLSALLGNIYLHKLDQEIGRILQKYEIPIVQRIRSVLLKTSRIDDQENSGEEESFNAPQDNRGIIVDRVKSIQRKAAFHSLVQGRRLGRS